MIFAHVVDKLYPRGQRMQQMHGLERVKATSRLALEEIGQQLTFNEFRYQKRHRQTVKDKSIPRVVLNHDRTVAQLVQFARIKTQCPVAQIAPWKEYLHGALDTCAALTNQIHLSLPTGPQA